MAPDFLKFNGIIEDYNCAKNLNENIKLSAQKFKKIRQKKKQPSECERSIYLNRGLYLSNTTSDTQPDEGPRGYLQLLKFIFKMTNRAEGVIIIWQTFCFKKLIIITFDFGVDKRAQFKSRKRRREGVHTVHTVQVSIAPCYTEYW